MMAVTAGKPLPGFSDPLSLSLEQLAFQVSLGLTGSLDEYGG